MLEERANLIHGRILRDPVAQGRFGSGAGAPSSLPRPGQQRRNLD
jgi:hypothetical protein